MTMKEDRDSQGGLPQHFMNTRGKEGESLSARFHKEDPVCQAELSAPACAP